MWTRIATLGLILTSPLHAAEEPLSAIDWLSHSLETERRGTTEGVTVEPLKPQPKRVGSIAPGAVGVAPDLWLGSPSDNLVALLRDMPRDMPLPLREALATLVSLDAPADDPGDDFLLARVDTLMSLGRLEAALRLVDAAESQSPELFRRTFDMALLTGREDASCQALELRPDIAPTYPARIFCLARRGDWQAAALTLETARALDVLTDEESTILGRFLDDGDGDMLPPPKRPEIVTPLAFRLYEAIGDPLATRGLPLAFAYADLRHQNGWKTRLEAAERLFRAGAIPDESLMALYTERQPAASGGVWTRAAAVQEWLAAKGSDKAAAAEAAVSVLEPAGLARLVEPATSPLGATKTHLAPDRDLGGLIADGRNGEAALLAILRAAEAWEGDPDDLARAVAALSEAGVADLPADSARQWADNR